MPIRVVLSAAMLLHDPNFRDLQFIVERFWNMQLIYIEFAVDARLPSGSNDMYLLKVLKAHHRGYLLCHPVVED
jgi:hypothetical protein